MYFRFSIRGMVGKRWVKRSPSQSFQGSASEGPALSVGLSECALLGRVSKSYPQFYKRGRWGTEKLRSHYSNVVCGPASWHCPAACWKCQISGSTSDSVNQNVHFKNPRWFLCILIWEAVDWEGFFQVGFSLQYFSFLGDCKQQWRIKARKAFAAHWKIQTSQTRIPFYNIIKRENTDLI